MIAEEVGQLFCVDELCGWVPLTYVGVAQKILGDKMSCLDELVVSRGRFEPMDGFQAIDIIDEALKDVNIHRVLKVKEGIGRAFTAGMQSASVRPTCVKW